VRPTFATLPDAISFLAERLDSNDHDAIAAACDGPPETPRNVAGEVVHWRRHQTWAIKKLAEAHTQCDLRERYAGREFPAGVRCFKLGGHEAELGHTHVDFLYTREGWLLERIWVCR